MQLLTAWAALGYIELRFLDETGFSMLPNIPYGWLPKGKQCGILADNKRVMNILGLMSLDHKLTSYVSQKSINSAFIIECLEDFCSSVEKPTVIVMDQAPWHTSKSMKEKLPIWEKKNMYVFYLPKYSPHLNAIEILCGSPPGRKIKYKWLKPEDYMSPHTLKKAVFNLLECFGSQFRINFSMNFSLLQ